MFNDVELKFGNVEHKFKSVEYKFNVVEYRFLLGVKTINPSFADNSF